MFKWKEELHISPLNQKLDMIKFRKEGMTKANIDPKARPFVAVNQNEYRKKTWKEIKVLLQESQEW